MIVAHLPAGYLVGQSVAGPLARRSGTSAKGLLAMVAFMSVAPDLDMLWYYFADHGQRLHHHFWTHIPAFWVLVGLCGGGVALVARSPAIGAYTLAATLGALLHIVLDTINGGILWLAPWSSQDFRWLEVPSRYDFWVANFLFHWSFVFELAILVAAFETWRRTRTLSQRAAGKAPARVQA